MSSQDRFIVRRTMAVRYYALTIFFLELLALVGASTVPGEQEWQQMMDSLFQTDTCKALYLSKVHGYEIQEHQITTKDNYRITLHRIIHPEDIAGKGPRPNSKKPYLLVHGLLGSSASFLRNVERNYSAPDDWFMGRKLAQDVLRRRSREYEHHWQSWADHGRPPYDMSSSFVQKVRDHVMGPETKPYARLDEVDYDADSSSFGREFKQAYRKFQLPKFESKSKTYLSNSLAFTLSNFGYDVWLINLRGNQYSQYYNGPRHASSAAYWDFNLDTLALEDLPAGLSRIRQVTRWQEPIGLVSYSYTCLHVLALLTKLPHYQKTIQPIVMLAPTTLTSTGHRKRQVAFKLATKALIAHNGPFPAKARSANDLFLRHICNLRILWKLCRVFEIFIHGELKTVSGMIFDSRRSQLLKADVDCGQTSTALVRQIVSNLSKPNVEEKYRVSGSRRLLAGGASNGHFQADLRRSVILIHSVGDEIANIEAVHRLKETALRLNTLVDYVIQTRDFGHVDFLFSKNAKQLVNAEVARIVSLFDYMLYEPSMNQPMSMTRAGPVPRP